MQESNSTTLDTNAKSKPQTNTPTQFEFDIKTTDPNSKARLCTLQTPHGAIETPIFMPVGTHATVKGILPSQLEEIKAQIILANTYHLYLRPGADLIEQAGGLHAFMNWNHPILTDSGGFQFFSLSDTLKLDDEGVSFNSIVDGSKHYWTPEKNMHIQNQLGADIIMQLDQCTPYPCEKKDVAIAVDRSAAWAKRCRAAQQNPNQALFAIVQGGVFLDLRLASVEHLLKIDSQSNFEGFALGGYSVGEPHELMFESLELVTDHLPKDRPRYLMGVGNPSTLVKAVAAGIDMFDCVLPTRNARNGTLYTSQGKINIKRKEFAEDDSPLDPACSCYTCRTFSRAYLRHLFQNDEPLAMRLASLHNLQYYLDLVRGAREALLNGSFSGYYKEFYEALDRGKDEGLGRA